MSLNKRYLIKELTLFNAVLGFFLISTDIVQYIFTELVVFLDRLPSLWITLYAVGLFFVTSFIPTSVVGRKNFSKYALVVSLFFWSFHLGYSRYYEYLQLFPKITSLNKNWTIQGDRVIIKGKNFGGEHEPGTVKVGDVQFVIIHWSDNRIVAEQPVPTHFFEGTLEVENRGGKKDRQGFQFEIIDPAKIHEKVQYK